MHVENIVSMFDRLRLTLEARRAFEQIRFLAVEFNIHHFPADLPSNPGNGDKLTIFLNFVVSLSTFFLIFP